MEVDHVRIMMWGLAVVGAGTLFKILSPDWPHWNDSVLATYYSVPDVFHSILRNIEESLNHMFSSSTVLDN